MFEKLKQEIVDRVVDAIGARRKNAWIAEMFGGPTIRNLGAENDKLSQHFCALCVLLGVELKEESPRPGGVVAFYAKKEPAKK